MRTMLLQKLLKAFILPCLFMAFSYAALAADRYVPGDHSTIQEAIDASAPGDVIHITGTYSNAPGTTINVNKAVTIQGEPGSKIETSGTAHLFDVSAAGVTFDNLEIEKTDDGVNQNIILISANNFELANSEIYAKYVMGDGEVTRALEIGGGATGLYIHDNTFSALRQPAYINNNVTGTIANNLAKGTRGWVLFSDCNITFTDNTWGTDSEVNYYDIAILSAQANNYPNIVAVSEANNDATIENQHFSYGIPAILSIVRVVAGAPCSPNPCNGSVLNPFPRISQSLNRVAVGGKVLVSSGTYDERITISKSARFIGQGATKPVINFTGTPEGNKLSLFNVEVDKVTINNFNFNVDLSKLKSAIIASGPSIDNITIINNEIGGYGTPSSGLYGDRNAVSINYGGPTNFRSATGGVDNVQFNNNVVTANGSSLFRAGIAADEASGSFIGNILQTINHDILVRFTTNGPVDIAHNEFHGGGVEIAEPNSGAGATSLTNNAFIGNFANVAAPNTAVLRLKNNQQNRPFTVSANTFTGYEWAVSLENFRNITIEKKQLYP